MRVEARTNKRDALLTIGAFSRRSRLSMKALRLYDQMDVLAPTEVDPSNGYRRYHESQLETARLIGLLRRLDMPLSTVAHVLAALGPVDGKEREPERRRAAAGLLDEFWDEVELRVAHQRELAIYLRIRLLGDEGSFAMFEIKEREVPDQLVLSEQRHLTVHELPEWIGAAGQRLMSAAEPYGGQTGPMTVIYHGEVNEDSDGPVEVCIPLRTGQDLSSDVVSRIEPAHREAYTRITKAQVAFPQILSAYDAVFQWVQSNGKSMSASPREVYFAPWDTAGPNDDVCDIAVPI